MNKTTFCPLPWKRLSINALGGFRVCCHTSPAVSLVRLDDGSYCSLPEQIETAWNSSLLKELRAAMKNGVWHSACFSCRDREKKGEISPRMQGIKLHPEMDPENLSVMSPVHDIESLDLRLGNKCNLKCRMCTPESSSAWRPDWNKLVGQDLPDNFREDSDKWLDDERTWDELQTLIPHLKEVLVTGGEPLLIAGNKRFLKACIDAKRASEMYLDYTTNGTIFDPELVELWKQFENVALKVSIDGLGKINEYIRYPSQWERVLENLMSFHEQTVGSSIQLSVYCTLQVYNIFHVDEFLKFFNSRGISVSFYNVFHPSCLSLNALTPSLAKKAREKIAELPWFPEQNGLLKTLQVCDESLWQDFCEYNRRLDQIRGQSLISIIPELAEEYNNTPAAERHHPQWHHLKR